MLLLLSWTLLLMLVMLFLVVNLCHYLFHTHTKWWMTFPYYLFHIHPEVEGLSLPPILHTSSGGWLFFTTSSTIISVNDISLREWHLSTTRSTHTHTHPAVDNPPFTTCSTLHNKTSRDKPSQRWNSENKKFHNTLPKKKRKSFSFRKHSYQHGRK